MADRTSFIESMKPDELEQYSGKQIQNATNSVEPLTLYKYSFQNRAVFPGLKSDGFTREPSRISNLRMTKIVKEKTGLTTKAKSHLFRHIAHQTLLHAGASQQQVCVEMVCSSFFFF